MYNYDTANPYAVTASFRRAGEDPVDWTYARELLDDAYNSKKGEAASIGLGDVRLSGPYLPPGRFNIIIKACLDSPDGEATLHHNAGALGIFLSQAYELVPEGAESLYLQPALDEAIAKILQLN
jgi:hypothetical protein